ncbi:MAG: dihydrofolate reductase [Bacteroidia bacterium]|nr:dihydrofolate reductase [Bacteroidia bacterium]
MRKIIAAINMTLDGFCDHTAMTGDEELHQHYTDLLRNAGAVLYGRTTYELMESYWPAVVKNPTGNKPMDDFAVAIENVSKIVFSHTLHNDEPNSINWKNVRLAKKDIKEEVLTLRQQPGDDIFVCSRSLIVATMNLGLVDAYQLCIHPVVAGKGLPLFKDANDHTVLKLLKTKTFGSGAILLYYEPTKK